MESTTSEPKISTAVLHWDNDPRNARNWSGLKKAFTTAIVCTIGFTSTIAASIYSSGVADVQTEFHVSSLQALFGLAFYNLGMAFGPIISSPLSETFGRRSVYMVTSPAFALFILGAGFSEDLASLTVCRFFAGLFGAPGVSIASATIADMIPAHKRGTALGMYYAIPMIGSLLGPLVGAFVTPAKGWRWTQWVVLFLAAPTLSCLVFTRESYRKTIMQRIAREMGEVVPLHNKSALGVGRHFLTTTIVRPVHMLLTEPIVASVVVYSSFQFALLYAFVVAIPYVYGTVYGFSPTAQGLSFIGFIIGAFLAMSISVLFDRYLYQKKYINHLRSNQADDASFPPENRLFGAMFGSFFIPLGLFLFAWSARPSVHWICPQIAQGCTMLGSICVYTSANMYMLDTYGPLYGASAAGASSLVRYVLAAAFPLFTLPMYETLGIAWATSTLAFCTVVMGPIPWVLWRWGPSLRARTRYERDG